MKNEYKNIMTSRWLRSFLFLAVVYFSQIYPFYHLHHFHADGDMEFEISSHPVEIDIEHSSDHHHDEENQHTNDHQHTYDKHIDWHIIRTQNPETLTLDNQYLFSSFSFILTGDNRTSCLADKKTLYIDDNYALQSIIRGPPLSG